MCSTKDIRTGCIDTAGGDEDTKDEIGFGGGYTPRRALIESIVGA